MRSMFLILAVMAIGFSASAEIECQGLNREIKNNKTSEQTVDLGLALNSTKSFRLEGDIDLYHFAVFGEHSSPDYLVMITEGPDYINGIIANTSFNSNGYMSNSLVRGNHVLKITCWDR